MSEKTLGQIAFEKWSHHPDMTQSGLHWPSDASVDAWECAANAVAAEVRKESAMEIERLQSENRELAKIVGGLQLQLAAQLKDILELDGTDNAHPAWWRGHESGVKGSIQRVTDMLDDIDDGEGISISKDFQAMRERILALVKQAKEQPQARFKVGDVVYQLGQKDTIQKMKIEGPAFIVKPDNTHWEYAPETNLMTESEAIEWIKKGKA